MIKTIAFEDPRGGTVFGEFEPSPSSTMRDYEEFVKQSIREIEERDRTAYRKRKRRYFLRQRIAGILLLAIALPSFLWLGDGIGTVVLTPIALGMIFQREIGRLERKIGRRWRQWANRK